jgi:hypothetical protein
MLAFAKVITYSKTYENIPAIDKGAIYTAAPDRAPNILDDGFGGLPPAATPPLIRINKSFQCNNPSAGCLKCVV